MKRQTTREYPDHTSGMKLINVSSSCAHCAKRELMCHRPRNKSKGKACLRCAEAKIRCVWPERPQTPQHKRARTEEATTDLKRPDARSVRSSEADESDIQDDEPDAEGVATRTANRRTHRSRSEDSSVHLDLGLTWSLQPEDMDDRELLIRALAEIQHLRRELEAEQVARASLALKMGDLRDVVLRGKKDMGVARRRAKAMMQYFQEQLDGMMAESDAQFTDDGSEVGSGNGAADNHEANEYTVANIDS